MQGRVDFKGWRFYIALNHSQQVKGVHSKLPNGKHFLMWDFDNVEDKDVIISLQSVQRRFKLPRIFLVNTGLKGFWHAYCFQTVEYPKLLYILASTPSLDPAYFKIGVIRGYFTLQYSRKKGRDFEPAIILPSKQKEDMTPFDATYGGKYWTKRL